MKVWPSATRNPTVCTRYSGAEVVRALLIEIEEGVPPDHEDERLRGGDGSGAQRCLPGLGSIEIQLDHSHDDHLTNPGIGTRARRSSAGASLATAWARMRTVGPHPGGRQTLPFRCDHRRPVSGAHDGTFLGVTRDRIAFVCSACGQRLSQWTGRCPGVLRGERWTRPPGPRPDRDGSPSDRWRFTPGRTNRGSDRGAWP